MKRVIDKITPSFIHKINDGLLKNSILGWQLQIPKILWLWLLISILSIPIAILYPLDLFSNSSKESMILMGVFIAILQFFLYGYIIIQFNSTKSFGQTNILYGIKEQLAYLFIMLLCLTNVVIFPFIIEWRTSKTMSKEQIVKETAIFNKARHYFMDNEDNYRYFPNKSYLLEYASKNNSSSDGRENYYTHTIEPLIAPFFSNSPYFTQIDAKFKRKDGVPQLYFIGTDFVYAYSNYTNSDFYNDRIAKNSENLNYQFQKKSDTERLQEIKAFIELNFKYKKLAKTSKNQYRRYLTEVKFDEPKVILERYKSNQFIPCLTTTNNSESGQSSIHTSLINDVHTTILYAEKNIWEHAKVASMVCFFVAFAFSILAFVFKNVRLKELILTFVYTAILILIVIIATLVSDTKEFIPLHTPIVLFFGGLFLTTSIYNWNHFSSIKTILIIISNVMFSLAPIFFMLYLHEYLLIGKYEHGYETYDYNAHYTLIENIRWACVWGGICFYLLVGSVIYKKAYEKIYALPLNK